MSKEEQIEKWKHVLERLKYWKNEDDKLQKGIDLFCENVCSTSYSPIINISCVYAFYDGIGFNDNQKEIMSWWLFEVESMEGRATLQKEIDGELKEWDGKILEQFIDFLVIEYPNFFNP